MAVITYGTGGTGPIISAYLTQSVADSRPAIGAGEAEISFDETTNATFVQDLLDRRDDFTVTSTGIVYDGASPLSWNSPSTEWLSHYSARLAFSALLNNSAVGNTDRDNMLREIVIILRRAGMIYIEPTLYPDP